jgi:uncharacterized protein (DUF2252 family)
MVDAAYWIKGCSSLGRLRYAVMLRVGEGKGSALCLVDLKEGVTAAAPRAEGVAMPRDNSVRVVTGAKALSPNLGDRMIAARFLDTGVVLRELLPQDLKIEVDRLTREEAMALAAYLAAVCRRRSSDAAMIADHLTGIDKFELWKIADDLRAKSGLASNEYFMPIMGLIFLRRATNRFYEAKAAINADKAAGRMPDRPLVEADFRRRRAL